MENPKFLHQKFRDLNTSPEVEAVVAREVADLGDSAKQVRTKELIPQKPEARIQTYLNYLKECLFTDDPHKREEKLARFKQVLHEKYVTKQKDIPESYWESVRRRHREEGHGEIEIPEEQKAELASDIVSEQTGSLDNWIDYLSSPDAEYPDWFKYYTIRSILRMNRYDKEKKRYTERTKGTVSPFPDLNRDALAFVSDALEKKQAGADYKFGYDIAPEEQQNFKQYIQQENFAKMYAWATEHFNPIPEELLKKTTGEWRKYLKDSNVLRLVKDISGYSTGWCIRGEATANRYLSHSDLDVYFSEDKDGNYAIPRVVVVRRDSQTQEVRGVAQQENLDPYISGVVGQKLAELPDGKLYEKKNQDMKQLTAIEQAFDPKTKQWKRKLTGDELAFLYEIDSKIQGFGYDDDDPRVKELRQQRDPKADAPIVFECSPQEIAWSKEDISENTKAYVGPLFPGIFKTLSKLEHTYTSFPEGKLRRKAVEIGDLAPEQLLAELKKQGFKISDYAKYMVEHMGESASQSGLAAKVKNVFGAKESARTESVDTIRLTVRDLGFDNGATTDEIYKKAEEFGLELCPAEVGPHFRLAYINQPMKEYLYIAMKQISDPDGRPRVFELHRYEDGVWLFSYWAKPDNRWDPEYEFVFRLRK